MQQCCKVPRTTICKNDLKFSDPQLELYLDLQVMGVSLAPFYHPTVCCLLLKYMHQFFWDPSNKQTNECLQDLTSFGRDTTYILLFTLSTSKYFDLIFSYIFLLFFLLRSSAQQEINLFNTECSLFLMRCDTSLFCRLDANVAYFCFEICL